MCPDGVIQTTNDLDSYFNFMESTVPPSTSIVTQSWVSYLQTKLNNPYNYVFFSTGQHSLPWGSELEQVFPGDYYQWAQALLAQALYQAVPSVRNNLNYDGVTSAIANLNGIFAARSTDLYIYYLRKKYHTERFDKEDYRKQLLDPYFRSSIAAKQASATWNNPSWEMYNHWVKFAACGAMQDDIVSVYNELTTQEPIIKLSGYTDIVPEVWRQYSSWHVSPIDSNLLHADQTSASYETTEYQTYCRGGMAASCTTIPCKVTHLYGADFVKSSPWYRKSGGSCFAAGTRVLMGDGTLRLIEDIQSGDEVRGGSNVRTVAFVSTPLRRGRSLYSINDCEVKFTETHPLASYDPDLASEELGWMAVSPAITATHIPTLKAHPYQKLDVDSRLLGYAEDELYPIEVNSLIQYPAQSHDEILYDLVLVPNGSLLDQYIVGDEETRFVVCSEIPSMTMYPLATLSFLRMIETLTPGLHLSALELGIDAHHEHTVGTMKRSLPWIYQEVSRRVQLMEMNPILQAMDMDIDMEESMTLFQSEVGQYNGIVGEAVDILSGHLIDLLPGEIEMGWRIPAVEGQNNHYTAVAAYHVSVPTFSDVTIERGCRLEFTCDGLTASIQESDAGELYQSGYLRHIAACAYFEGTNHQIIKLNMRDKVREWEGELHLPQYLKTTERIERQCILRNQASNENVTITLVVYGVSTEQYQEEQESYKTWDTARKSIYAIQFGEALGHIISEELNQYRPLDVLNLE